LKKSDPIAISFLKNIPHTTGHQHGGLVSHLTHCLFLHYLGKNEQNIAFLTTLVLLRNQNNTQNTHFVHSVIILANSLSNCLFFNCLQNVWNVGPRTWARLGDTFSFHW